MALINVNIEAAEQDLVQALKTQLLPELATLIKSEIIPALQGCISSSR